MAVDMFLIIADHGGKQIPGESNDKLLKGEKAIDILSWSWGASNSSTGHTATGSGSGKCNVQDMSITKYTDSSSATLWNYCCVGKHLKTGRVIARKSTGNAKPLEYMVISFEEAFVTSVHSGGSGGEDRLTETFTFSFTRWKLAYTPQKEDGTPAPAITFGWNVAQNAEWQ